MSTRQKLITLTSISLMMWSFSVKPKSLLAQDLQRKLKPVSSQESKGSSKKTYNESAFYLFPFGQSVILKEEKYRYYVTVQGEIKKEWGVYSGLLGATHTFRYGLSSLFRFGLSSEASVVLEIEEMRLDCPISGRLRIGLGTSSDGTSTVWYPIEAEYIGGDIYTKWYLEKGWKVPYTCTQYWTAYLGVKSEAYLSRMPEAREKFFIPFVEIEWLKLSKQIFYDDLPQKLLPKVKEDIEKVSKRTSLVFYYSADAIGVEVVLTQSPKYTKVMAWLLTGYIKLGWIKLTGYHRLYFGLGRAIWH